jgi:hypothetical protein
MIDTLAQLSGRSGISREQDPSWAPKNSIEAEFLSGSTSEAAENPLGHSKIQIVHGYARPTQEHQARSVEQVKQFIAARQMEALSQKHGAEEEIIL